MITVGTGVECKIKGVLQVCPAGRQQAAALSAWSCSKQVGMLWVVSMEFQPGVKILMEWGSSSLRAMLVQLHTFSLPCHSKCAGGLATRLLHHFHTLAEDG
jgi:hypothetical protein